MTSKTMNSRKVTLEMLRNIENDLDNKIHSLESINEKYRLGKKYVIYMQKEQHAYEIQKKNSPKKSKNVPPIVSQTKRTISINSLSQDEVDKHINKDVKQDMNPTATQAAPNHLGLSINVDDLLLKARSMKFVGTSESTGIDTSRSDTTIVSKKGVLGTGTTRNSNSKSKPIPNRTNSTSSSNSNSTTKSNNSNGNSSNLKKKSIMRTNPDPNSKAKSTKASVANAMTETKKVKPNLDSTSNISQEVQQKVEIEVEMEVEPYNLFDIYQQIECVNSAIAQHCTKSEKSDGSIILNSNIKLYNHKYAYHPPPPTSTNTVSTGPDGRIIQKLPISNNIIDIPRNYSPCIGRYNQLHPMHSTMNNAKLNSVYENMEFLKKTRNIGNIRGIDGNGSAAVGVDSHPMSLKLQDLHVCQPLFLFLQNRHHKLTGDGLIPNLHLNPIHPTVVSDNNDDSVSVGDLNKNEIEAFIHFVLNESRRIYELLLEIVQTRSNKPSMNMNRNHLPVGVHKVHDMISYWCTLNICNQILSVFLLMNQDQMVESQGSANGTGSANGAHNDEHINKVEEIEEEIDTLYALPLFTPGTSSIQVEYLMNNPSSGSGGNGGNGSRNHMDHVEKILKQYCSVYHSDVKNMYTSIMQMMIGKLCVKPLITEIKNTCMMKPSDEIVSAQQYAIYNQNWINVLKKFKLLRMCFSDKPVYFTLDK